MAVAQGPFLAAVLLLSSGLHCFTPLPGCPELCTGQRTPLLNCSSSGLSLVPQCIQDSVTELDLSHNLLDSVTLDRPHHNLRNVWLGNNSITRLSLCIKRNLGGHNDKSRYLHRLRPWSRRRCVSWAPTLQLLSVERNQLEQLPEGLEVSESLQVLQLSFNRISTLQPGDLSHLRQLKELHLQHNLITSLHPQIFQDLAQLQVLDLSFNKLTSLHSSMYLSLRGIGADVRLGGNRWQCDCSMRSLRRWMAYDSSRGLQAWSVVCASPSILSGKDLLQLEEDDLTCFSTENRPELHQDVTVYSGSEILLSCSSQDSMWWMPSGRASVSQPQAGLLISDATERDTGLYVCVSEEHEVVSVFNLQISKIEGARRKTRSLPRHSRQIIPKGTPNRIGEERNQRAIQSDLTLAVCLSVFITFLIAFILGVLARPCIDVLLRRVTKKKSSETNPVSSVQQRQYDNEGYSNSEEPEAIGIHRERRVTFSTIDIRENSNVQYYDTVASDIHENINTDAVIECETAENDSHTTEDSGSEKSLQQNSPERNQKDDRDLSGITDAGRTQNIEFEHIPDPVVQEKRRSLSSCSDSSLSGKVSNEDKMLQRYHTTPKSPQLAEDSVQQSADFWTARKEEVPPISIEGSEIPGFSSEPFADWSPHTKNPNLTDPELWQENEEQFEFSDSVRSISARSSSVCGSFGDSKRMVAFTSDKQKRDDMSSSSSYVSGDEPTEYSVNLDEEEEENIERNHSKPEVTNAFLKQDASFSFTPSVGLNQGDYRYDTQRDAVRPKHSFSSCSSDSDGESICVSDKLSSRIVTEEWDTRKKVECLGVTSHGKSLDTGAPSPPAAYSSSSSSESEEEITDLKVELNTGRVNEGIKIIEPETLSTDLDHQPIPRFKRRLDINTPVPASDSTSSDESMDETTKFQKEYQSVSHDSIKPQWPSLDLSHVSPIKRHLDIRAPSPPTGSSSSSDSDDVTTNHINKQEQEQMHMARLPLKESQTEYHDPDTLWPVLDLEHTTRTKRHLDIKAPSPASDSSSSSDCEDETTHLTERPEKLDMAEVTFQKSQTISHNRDIRWPALELERIPRIKRHLDIEAILPPTDEEKIAQIKRQEQEEVHVSRLPFQESQAKSHDPEEQWPAIDLEHTMRIKRCLDIKASSPPSDSSSSSDSEDETTIHIEKQRPDKVDIAGHPFLESQTEYHDPGTQWPALDLEHTTRIKRHLDIKPPSPASDSSSSSDSENETTHHKKKDRLELMGIERPSFQVSQTGSHDRDKRWPALDLENTRRIKRRLDIKVPSPASDSSSSSDSEDETTGHIEKQRLGKVDIIEFPLKESQTESHDPDTQWPALDLEHTTRIKRHLDIKAPSPASDSSSSSDSEDGTTHQTERPEKLDMAEVTFLKSQTISHNRDIRWPALELERIPHIKRHLDIKAILPPTDVEKIAQIKRQEQEEVHVSRLPFQESQVKSHDPEEQWPAIDLEHTMRIKRCLDIKASSPPSDSSSSSDSEDETTGHIEKQRPHKVDIAGHPFLESQTESHDRDTQWPVLDLEHTTRIKRHLDIKAPSPASDSSSSSDSENETTHHKKKDRLELVGIERPSFQVSQTESHDRDKRWPALDLEHTNRVKRHLDIKAPSPASDSSSSSDSEDETTGHIEKQRLGKVDIIEFPLKESQTESHDPDTQWPALDLEHTTRIKRHLDIKAPSPASDSSSSSDSEDGTTHQTERPEKLDMAEVTFLKSQTISHNRDIRWPALELERIPHIKRHLDIKAILPPTDVEKIAQIKRQEQEEVHVSRLPFQESQVKSHDPEEQWPAIDLEHTMRIKRCLDIKASSPPSDSSSSSDSEDETTGHIEKQRPHKVDIAGHPFLESQTESHDRDTQWPVLDLEHTTRIKRHLDIKAPSPASDSSSSSDSENETTHHKKKDRLELVGIERPSFQVSQTESHDRDKRWPALDLEHTNRVKRHLDIKAPSPASDSSSSSDSEDETTGHIEKQRLGKVDIIEFPLKESQTESHDPDTQWPALDLEHTNRVKRHLDIKAPSPNTDLSSSSDSDDETTGHIEKQRGKVDIAGLPLKESHTEYHDPDKRWPALDLEHSTRIKRRLDIKAPSPTSDSSSSSDSENETTHHIKKQEQMETFIPRLPIKVSQTVSDDPQTQWPALDLEYTTRIKRRLDIKAPSQASDSPSSSDNENETTHHTKKDRPELVGTEWPSFQESQTVSSDPETQWPAVDLDSITRIKRRLDIKVLSTPPSSLLSGGSMNHKAEGKRKEAIKTNPSYSSSSSDEQEEGMERSPPTTVEPDPDSRWPQMDLSTAPHVKRRLDIKASSPLTESSSSSDESESGTTDLPVKVERDRTDVNLGTKLSDSNLSIPLVKRRFDIKAPFQSADSYSSDSDNESRLPSHTVKQRYKGDVRITNYKQQTKLEKLSLDVPYISRRLDIKAPSPQPEPILSNVSPPFQQSELNSSRSDSEGENRDHAKLALGVSATEKDFFKFPKTPVIHTSSPKTDPNIILEKYTIITDDVGDKTTKENIITTPDIKPEFESRWATMNLGFSRFRQRLQITTPTHELPNVPSSPPPDSSSSSSSDKGTGSKGSRTRRKRREVEMQGIIRTESSTPENKQVNVSLSLNSQDDISGHSIEVKEILRQDYSLPKTEEKSKPGPVLTGFGTPHFKRYLDIEVSEKAPASPSLQQLSDSSSSSENEDASTEHVDKGKRGGFQLPVITDKEASQIHTSLYVAQAVNIKQSQTQTEEVERKARVELKSQASKAREESDSVQPRSGFTYIPHIRRALDIRAPLQREASSSSDSENEMIDNSVLGLSLGVPRIKRRLHVKAPLPETSNSPSSCSENETEMTEMTDNDSLITYKRLIFKPSSPLNNYLSHSGPTIGHTNQRHTGAEMVTVAQEGPPDGVEGRNPSLDPVRVTGMTFDDVVKKRIEQSKHITDVDLPSEIRWTGVGRQPSDLFISSPKRHLDVGLSTPQHAPPVDPAPFDSSYSPSSKNYDKLKQEILEMNAVQAKYSTLSANSLASSRALDNSDNPPSRTNEILRSVDEDRRERRGFSALKAMSSERQKWDTQAETLDKGASPLFDDYGPKVDTNLNYERSKDIKPLAKQPVTQLNISSTSVDESRSTDWLYGIPNYRRHSVGGIKQLQETPPPIPATPPPDELTWSSPQSREKQGLGGTRSKLEQSRNREESDPSSYFYSSNISHV